MPTFELIVPVYTQIWVPALEADRCGAPGCGLAARRRRCRWQHVRVQFLCHLLAPLGEQVAQATGRRREEIEAAAKRRGSC